MFKKKGNKKVVKNTELIDSELKKCADDLMSSDIAMEQIFELIKRSTEEESDDDKFFEDAIKCLHEGGVLWKYYMLRKIIKM